MAKEIFLEDIERILFDVKPEQCFWVHNGPIVRYLYELEIAIEHMNNETFKYHVHNSRNDFANWIRDVIKDEELADIMLKVKSKDEILKKVRNRIKFIERKLDEERFKSSNLESIRDKIRPLPIQLVDYRNTLKDDMLSKDTLVFILGLLIGVILGIVVAVKFNIG
jgi:hypothetical protein